MNQEKAKNAIKVKQNTTTLSGTMSFEEEGRLFIFTPSEPLPQNQTLTITITTELEDLSWNKLESEFNQEFVFTGDDLIIYDRIAPEVELVRLNSGRFYIEFSEEIDSSAISNSVELSSSSGAITGTTSLENSKTIIFTPSTTLSRNVQYTITVKTAIKDLSGKSLSEQFSKSFTYTGGDILIFEKPDPNESKTSYISNTTLFQGREYDPETGLYYFRARYYHPELGRFISEDPHGYVDSFNLSQAFLANPVNFSDPFGKKNDWEIGPFVRKEERVGRTSTGFTYPTNTRREYLEKVNYWQSEIPGWEVAPFQLSETLKRLKFSSERERFTAGLMFAPVASAFTLVGGGFGASAMGVSLGTVKVMVISGIVGGTTSSITSVVKEENPLTNIILGTSTAMSAGFFGTIYAKPEIPIGIVTAISDIISQYANKGKWEDPISSIFSGLIGASTPTIKSTLKALAPNIDEITLEWLAKSISGASKIKQVIITQQITQQITKEDIKNQRQRKK